MSNNGADIYLILLRPTRVPVLGEAVSNLFQGQVLIESLRWNLHNEDEAKGADKAVSSANPIADSGEGAGLKQQVGKDLDRALGRAIDEHGRAIKGAESEADRLRLVKQHRSKVDDLLKSFHKKEGGADAVGKDGEDDEHSAEYYESQGRNRNFEITFTKRVDIASTQMLNSMKAGDIFPSGTLTIHKRSATMMDGTSLVFNIQKIRLLEYKLQVETTDTMTEMMEEWTAEFGALAYVYKNPPSHYSHGNAGQAAAKTLSQGTMRAFTMKNIGSPL
jgi:type VI protein secretion system component Hcp